MSLGQEQTLPMVNLQTHLPVLTSHCPGWVCYAEKTSPQAIPYMSTVKSAQQIVGTIVKNLILSDNARALDVNCHPNHEAANSPSCRKSSGSDAILGLAGALNNLSVDDLNLDKKKCCGAGGHHTSNDSHSNACAQTTSPHKPLSSTTASTGFSTSPVGGGGAGGGHLPKKRVIVISVQPCFDKKLEASRRVSRCLVHSHWLFGSVVTFLSLTYRISIIRNKM
jgi:hypothetical protein